MTDAKELRIGNLIYWNEPKKIGVPHEVILVSNQGMIHTHPISLGKLPDDYSPIELSEEWLLRFRFHADNYGVFEKFENDTNTSDSRIELWVKKCWNGEKWTWDISIGHELDELTHLCYIDYLHQVQNIYFVLYGKELTIKP